MLFVTPTFLFLFLPLALALFFVLPRVARTPFLVVASLFFYAWAEKQLVLLLVGSCVFNWAMGLAIDRTPDALLRRLAVAVAVAVNIGALAWFKYAGFFVSNLNAALGAFSVEPVAMAPVHLPLAVSFVTFEAVSYVVDVYRREIAAARNVLHVAFFLSFFPHLIAGPLLRFRNVADVLARPSPTLAQFDSGVSRFVTGLAKKMLLANPLGQVADEIFALGDGQLHGDAAWLGAACFTLQIYFDFSGYSDMAIGIGRMFGFSLPENFRWPYAADSVRDFWRRWHMTLSSWFRDYLFIPLGGSRRGPARTHFNLLAVFLLCGLWHGASWTFVVWGGYHGIFLVLERLRFGRVVGSLPWPLRRSYVLLVVVVGWVIFRAESLPHAMGYLAAMAGAADADGPRALSYVTRELAIALAAGAMFSLVPWPELLERGTARRSEAGRRVWMSAETAAQLALFAVSLLYVAAGTTKSFIYFRF